MGLGSSAWMAEPVYVETHVPSQFSRREEVRARHLLGEFVGLVVGR